MRRRTFSAKLALGSMGGEAGGGAGSAVCVERDDVLVANPDVDAPLPKGGDLVLVGTDDAEATFAKTFRRSRRRIAG